jgi:hypothetical protein
VIYTRKPVPQRQSGIGCGGAVGSGEPMDEEVEEEMDCDAMLNFFEQELYNFEDDYTNDADNVEDADEGGDDEVENADEEGDAFEEIISEDVYKKYMKRKN